MAALGTIRKRGVILVCIISFGLFAFQLLTLIL